MEKNVLWYSSEKFKLGKKPIRLIELFSGIGAQSKSLDVLGVDYEHYRICEFDESAVKSYNAVHHTDFETSDITKINSDYLGIVDTDKYNYVMTYSFPCTDLSLAGLQSGMSKEDWKSGKSTRSGLLWEVERLLDECYVKNGKEGLPQCLLMENVPQVIGKKNINDFTMWVAKLEALGYSNFYKILNAAEVGYPEPIPQHRERCFMVSILGDYNYTFPGKSKLNKRLKDLLEPVVDEKYYLSKKQVSDIQKWNAYEKPLETMKKIEKSNQSPTLTTRSGAYAAGMVLINENSDEQGMMISNNTEKGYLVANDGDGVDISGRMQYHRGTVQKGMSQTLKTSPDVGVCVGTYEEPHGWNVGGVKETDTCDSLRVTHLQKIAMLEDNLQSCVDDFIKENNKNAKHQQDLLQSEDDVCRTIPAGTHGSTPHLLKTIVSEDGRLLKEKLCNKLVDEGMVEEGDVVKHSYTTRIMNGEKKAVEKSGEMVTLTTRPDCVGVCVNDDSVYSESEKSLFTEDGNIKRYAYSDVVDKFEEGTMVSTSYPNGYGHGSRVTKNSHALNCSEVPSVKNNLRIRKLTPKETWRLMGFEDSDWQAAHDAGVSDSQLYKQAGNSIVVNCLAAIFKNLI